MSGQSTPEKRRETLARYYAKHKEAQKTRTRIYTMENREKRRAHWIVGQALKYGTLVKTDACEDCGKATKLDGTMKIIRSREKSNGFADLVTKVDIEMNELDALAQQLAQASKERDELKHDIEKSMTVSNIYLNEVDILKAELAEASKERDEANKSYLALSSDYMAHVNAVGLLKADLAAARAELAEAKHQPQQSQTEGGQS